MSSFSMFCPLLKDSCLRQDCAWWVDKGCIAALCMAALIDLAKASMPAPAEDDI